MTINVRNSSMWNGYIDALCGTEQPGITCARYRRGVGVGKDHLRRLRLTPRGKRYSFQKLQAQAMRDEGDLRQLILKRLPQCSPEQRRTIRSLLNVPCTNCPANAVCAALRLECSAFVQYCDHGRTKLNPSIPKAMDP